MKSAFTVLENKTGLLYDYSKNQHPTLVWGFNQSSDQTYIHHSPANDVSTLFVYFYLPGYLNRDGVNYFMQGDTYCSIKRDELDYIQGGRGFIIERIGYEGMFMVGGPVEPDGRLMYIDGCKDSLLIPPVKLGDPCFNALFFPSGIDQTSHTHPSMRVGMVIRGCGVCWYVNEKESLTYPESIELKPGMLFIIHEEGLHKFQTVGTDGMVVVAWHPDSDFGPQDENHPMINRTIVQGVSARDIPEIQTKHISHGTNL
jgi:hypothetical protein